MIIICIQVLSSWVQPPQSQVCFSPVIVKLIFPFKVLLYAPCWQIYCRTTHHIYLLSKHWLSASPNVRHCASFWVPKDECSSVQFSPSVVSDSLQPHGLQQARPPCLSPTPRVYPNSCPSSQWCHPTISSSVIPFSSHLQSFPASGSFQMSQLFASGGQSIGVSASTSVLPMNTQDWSPLGWTGWISLKSKTLNSLL